MAAIVAPTFAQTTFITGAISSDTLTNADTVVFEFQKPAITTNNTVAWLLDYDEVSGTPTTNAYFQHRVGLVWITLDSINLADAGAPDAYVNINTKTDTPAQGYRYLIIQSGTAVTAIKSQAVIKRK